MAVFRAGLPRPHNQFFCTASLRIDVDDHRQAGQLELPKAEIRNFDLLLLGFRQNNAGFLALAQSLFAILLDRFVGQHGLLFG